MSPIDSFVSSFFLITWKLMCVSPHTTKSLSRYCSPLSLLSISSFLSPPPLFICDMLFSLLSLRYNYCLLERNLICTVQRIIPLEAPYLSDLGDYYTTQVPWPQNQRTFVSVWLSPGENDHLPLVDPLTLCNLLPLCLLRLPSHDSIPI